LKIHGGGDAAHSNATTEIERGLEHLDHHIRSVHAFGFEPIIAINCFPNDREQELAVIEHWCAGHGLNAARFTGFSDGGAGAEALAQAVASAAAQPKPAVRYLYDLESSPETKIAAVAQTIYGASTVEFSRIARKDLERINLLGFDRL